MLKMLFTLVIPSAQVINWYIILFIRYTCPNPISYLTYFASCQLPPLEQPSLKMSFPEASTHLWDLTEAFTVSSEEYPRSGILKGNGQTLRRLFHLPILGSSILWILTPGYLPVFDPRPISRALHRTQVQKDPMFGLILSSHYLEIPRKFIFELLFCRAVGWDNGAFMWAGSRRNAYPPFLATPVTYNFLSAP